MTAPHQEPREPLEGPFGREPSQPDGSRSGELVGPRLVALAPEVVEDRRRDARRHPLGGEGARHGPTAGFAPFEGVLGHGSREGLVVDQAHPLEALELGGDLVAVEPRRQESALELAAAPLTDGEESERPLVDVAARRAGSPRAHAGADAFAFFAAGSSSRTTSGTISIG